MPIFGISIDALNHVTTQNHRPNFANIYDNAHGNVYFFNCFSGCKFIDIVILLMILSC